MNALQQFDALRQNLANDIDRIEGTVSSGFVCTCHLCCGGPKGLNVRCLPMLCSSMTWKQPTLLRKAASMVLF